MTKLDLIGQIQELTSIVNTLFARYRVLVIEEKVEHGPYPKHIVLRHWGWDSTRFFNVVHGFGTLEDVKKISTHYQIPEVLFQREVSTDAIRNHLKSSGFRNGYFAMDTSKLGFPDWPYRRNEHEFAQISGAIQFFNPTTGEPY